MNEFVPSEFYLGQNYPNPFKERTIIKYCIAYKIRVKLTVYNSEGEEIKKLVDEEKKPGTYEVEFQSAVVPNAFGKSAIGSYYYRLEAGGYKSEKKMEII
jgi:hypothetical protein